MIIYKAVYLPTLLRGSESCAILTELLTRLTGAEVGYLRKCTGKPVEIELEIAKLQGY
jgi:hypothetical protein